MILDIILFTNQMVVQQKEIKQLIKKRKVVKKWQFNNWT